MHFWGLCDKALGIRKLQALPLIISFNSEALEAKGFSVDRKKIAIEDIKSIGDYKAVLDLHKDVKHELTVSVVQEAKAE